MSSRSSPYGFPCNEVGLVDKFIGTAYDTVKTVYDNLDIIAKVAGDDYLEQFVKGSMGWSPVFRTVEHGSKVALEIYDWYRAHPDTAPEYKPVLYGYLSPNGIVSDIDEATDIRGQGFESYGILLIDDFIQSTDESASEAFQRVHDYFVENTGADNSGGCTVVLGSKHYRLGSAVTFDMAMMRVVGQGAAKGTIPTQGSWLIIDDPSFTPFKITRASTTGEHETRGSGFYNVGIYQVQPGIVAGETWTPTAYPYIFDCDGLLGEFTLNEIHCISVTNLLNSKLSGRMNVTNITGQVLKNVVYLDECYDIPRFINWHIWTYWTSADPVMAYVQDEFDAIILGRVDTPILDHMFIFAGRSLVKTVQTAAGIPTKLLGGTIACDFTKYGIWVTSPGFTAMISNMSTQHQSWPAGSGNIDGGKSIHLETTADNADIRIANMHGTEMDGEAVYANAVNAHIDIKSAVVERINQNGDRGVAFGHATANISFGRCKIVESPNTYLTVPGGSLISTGVQMNMLPEDDATIFLSSGAPGVAAKLYVYGRADSKDLELGAHGEDALVRSLNGFQIFARTVADLPDVGSPGAQYYVTDSVTTRPGSAVVGGGVYGAHVEYVNGAYRVVLTNDLNIRSAERLAQEQVLREYGATFNGTADDAAAIQAYINSFGTRGGHVVLPALTTRLNTPIVVDNATVAFKGVVPSYALNQGTAVSVNVADAFDLRNADGFMFTNAHLRSTGAALLSGSMFDFKASDQSSSNSGMLLFDNLRIEAGWNGFTFRKVFQAQLRGVRVANFAGEYCFGHNGLNDETQANIFEYMGVTAGGVRYSNCDLWVFNGGGGSAKFTDCAGNFGRHGMNLKSDTSGTARTITSIVESPEGGFRITTLANHGFANGAQVIIDGVTPDNGINTQWAVTRISDTVFDLYDSEYVTATYTGGTATAAQGRDPGFIYWNGGGFENLGGDAWRLERGGKLLVSNAYFSTDSDGHVVNQFATYKGRHKFTNCDIRAAGGAGIFLRAGMATYTGCDITNNGRVYVDNLKVDLGTCVDNGSGFARFTSLNPHGYSTGDRVRTSRTNGCDGQSRITVIDAYTFDADSIAYVAGAANGQSWRYYRGLMNVTDNGSGLPRINCPGYSFRDGEWVHFSTASFGVPGIAGSDFKIKVVDADNFDLVLKIDGTIPAFSGAFTGSGYVQRCGAQIIIASGAKDVEISGGYIGTTSGVNRSRYAIIIEPGCTNINIDSSISLDARSGVVNLSASEPSVKINNRRTPKADMIKLLEALTPVNNTLLRVDGNGNMATIAWTSANGQSFVPTVTCATPGDLTVAYGTVSGTSRKRDRLVEIDVVIVFTPTYTTAAGDFRIAGLPYSADGNTAYACIPFSSLSAFTWPNTSTQIYMEVIGNQAYMTLVGQKNGASNQTQPITNFVSGQTYTLRFRGSYIAAS